MKFGFRVLNKLEPYKNQLIAGNSLELKLLSINSDINMDELINHVQ